MAKGWGGEDAVQDQIDSTVDDAVRRVRRELPVGESARNCRECGQPIPQARREALPGVRLCIACQAELDRQPHARSGHNRRGSKDSQLR